VARHAEGPHVIGRVKGLLNWIGWIFLHVRANSERERVWSLIGQWTVHRRPMFPIGREAVFGGFRGESNWVQRPPRHMMGSNSVNEGAQRSG